MVMLNNESAFQVALTAGENIDGTTTPQAVCVKDSDGKIYKADANDTALVNFIGFVTGNYATNDLAVVFTGDRCGGFTGLTEGAMYHVTDTAGGVSTTPSATCIIPVGKAVSSTEILVFSGKKITTGTINHSRTNAATGNDDQTVTLGFRPSVIVFSGVVDAYQDGSVRSVRGTYTYHGTTLGVAFGVSIDNSSNVTFTNNPPGSTLPVAGSNRGSGSLSLNSISDTGFVHRMAQVVSAGTPTNTATVTFIAYE
jgi:hypothetical protein